MPDAQNSTQARYQVVPNANRHVVLNGLGLCRPDTILIPTLL